MYALLLSLFLLFQVSQGTTSIPGSIVFSVDGECSQTDIAVQFINDRSTVCPQGQTRFFNGEIRNVQGGTGSYVQQPENNYNGYELTSCACSNNAVWSRVHKRVTTAYLSWVQWGWKMYGRDDNCQLTLKRNLSRTDCRQAYDGSSGICPPCPEGYASEVVNGSCECVLLSPIVIDLVGDGINFSSRANGVLFDLDGNGESGQVPWTKDAWLVLNDERNFYVANGSQFFGDRSPQPPGIVPPYANGWTALSLFDDNKDGKITPADGVWNLLAVWRDDGNGVSDIGEVVALDFVGLTSISLKYNDSRRVDDYGNKYPYCSQVKVNGVTRQACDVYPAGN
jgi:hypothetical protein